MQVDALKLLAVRQQIVLGRECRTRENIVPFLLSTLSSARSELVSVFRKLPAVPKALKRVVIEGYVWDPDEYVNDTAFSSPFAS